MMYFHNRGYAHLLHTLHFYTPLRYSEMLYTPWATKTCHFVCDHNPGVSWSIFTLFVPAETGMNTLQYAYYDIITMRHIARHKSSLYRFWKLNMSWRWNFDQKSVGMWKFFLQKTDKIISYQELEKTNIEWLSIRKLRTTGSIECTVMIDFKMCCFTVF